MLFQSLLGKIIGEISDESAFIVGFLFQSLLGKIIGAVRLKQN